MIADLDAAYAHVIAAADYLVEWRARQSEYVAAGRDCVESIDDALGSLHEARAALLIEIHRDEIRTKIRQIFDEEGRIAAAERGSREVEEAYRDGVLRVVSALGLMDAVPVRQD